MMRRSYDFCTKNTGYKRTSVPKVTFPDCVGCWTKKVLAFVKQQLSRFFEKLSAEAAADPLCGLRRPGADGRDVLVASESSPRIIPSGKMERSGRTCTSSKALLNSHQWCEVACPEEGDRTLRISKFLHRRNCHTHCYS